MNDVSAQFEASWSGFGQLDSHYRSVLSPPDSALNENIADLLADVSCRMVSRSPVSSQQLISSPAQEDLPPIDFADFPTSQPAEQPYPGIFPAVDDPLLSQTQTGLPEFPPKSPLLSQPHSVPQAGEFSFASSQNLIVALMASLPSCTLA